MGATMEHTSTEIPLLRGDAGFAQEVTEGPGGDTLPLCYQCGTCTGCCPVGAVDDAFSPALIIQWIRLGLRERVLGSPKIWLCLQCHRCSFSCPQGVRFADINGTLRHMAVREGFVDAATAEKLAAVEKDLAALRCAVLERAMGKDPNTTPSTDELVREALRDLHG
uniref:4Fe-4S ferredoxin-type domain-containing protein n=1 Tax=Desulfacinum infernum TaxID=35837 RepID=A0A831ZSS3_9BACT